MEDYWGNAGNGDATTSSASGIPPAAAIPAVDVTAVGDDDIDMIE